MNLIKIFGSTGQYKIANALRYNITLKRGNSDVVSVISDKFAR